MGVVYKARQVYLNQTVALKILPHRYLDDAQAVSRFRREMQSIGGLNHPNIVRAYNAGEAGGVHFLVMEFVDGINLQQFVAAGVPPGGPLGVGAACEIIRQAALGLQHAHEHQLVHRDVKPANLMLCRNGQVKLLDLGLAKFHAERRGDAQPQGRLTQPGITMGTIDYMAPEQWENSATADIRSDIYSLGCTLFFLLTGKPPYGDPAYDTSRKKLMAHVVAPIPSLLDNCPDCPQDLEEVYETMMAKDPRERFAVPAEVAEAMAEFADEEEVGRGDCRRPDRRRLDRREQRQSPEPRGGHGQAAGGRIGGVQRPPPLAKPADGQAEIPSECATGCLRIAAGRDPRPPGLGGDAARRRRGGKLDDVNCRGVVDHCGVCDGDRACEHRHSAAGPQFDCRRIGPAARAERPVVVRRNALADAVPAAGDCRQSAGLGWTSGRPWVHGARA